MPTSSFAPWSSPSYSDRGGAQQIVRSTGFAFDVEARFPCDPSAQRGLLPALCTLPLFDLCRPYNRLLQERYTRIRVNRWSIRLRGGPATRLALFFHLDS